MKIGNPADKFGPVAPTAPQAAAAETAKTGKAASATVAPVGVGADASATVALSSTASTLLSGGTNADFDADKVARIADAIAGGTFTVNADAIADKLIANAQELLTKASA